MTTGARAIVHITRRIAATPERVFDAWVSAEDLGRWMFGPGIRDEEIVRLTLDPRVGRSFSFVVRRGGREIDHVGTYVELERPGRLAFTWTAAPMATEGAETSKPDDSRVIVSIASRDSATELDFVHEMAPEWSGFVTRAEIAWATMLNSLARFLETS